LVSTTAAVTRIAVRDSGKRWDRDSGWFFAFVLVACALVCCNRL
jgi:hypothetical protein